MTVQGCFLVLIARREERAMFMAGNGQGKDLWNSVMHENQHICNLKIPRIILFGERMPE